MQFIYQYTPKRIQILYDSNAKAGTYSHLNVAARAVRVPFK
jgi:hypothetical protein